LGTKSNPFTFKKLKKRVCRVCGTNDNLKVVCDSHSDPNPETHFFVKCNKCFSEGPTAWGVVSAIREWNHWK
jgi:hypothetical protein